MLMKFFKCDYCPSESPYFKGLVNHYLECHADKLKQCRPVVQGIEKFKIFAPTDTNACESLAFAIRLSIEEFERKEKEKANVST